MHTCRWTATGLALEVTGLYAGYVEHQQCTDLTCGRTQSVRLQRTMPDVIYTGELNKHNCCACPTCRQARKTWRLAMICPPCRKAGCVLSAASEADARSLEVMFSTVVDLHEQCKGGTWCDCSHSTQSVVGKTSGTPCASPS